MSNNFPAHIQQAWTTLNSNESVSVQDWTDYQVEQALDMLLPFSEKINNKNDQYVNFCGALFQRWSITKSPRKCDDLPVPRSNEISLNKIALILIENHNPAVSAILPYINAHFRSSLFLRHAIQEKNLNAVCLLLPRSNIEDVADFGVEMASRTANGYLLDVFLPYANLTALNYHLVRYATHRYIQASKNKEEHEQLLQKILYAVDQLHISKTQAPLTDNLNAIENLDPSVHGVLGRVAKKVRFDRKLKNEAFAAHHQTASRNRPPARKM